MVILQGAAESQREFPPLPKAHQEGQLEPFPEAKQKIVYEPRFLPMEKFNLPEADPIFSDPFPGLLRFSMDFYDRFFKQKTPISRSEIGAIFPLLSPFQTREAHLFPVEPYRFENPGFWAVGSGTRRY